MTSLTILDILLNRELWAVLNHDLKRCRGENRDTNKRRSIMDVGVAGPGQGDP
jgi:hypothetical protein